MWTVRSAQCAVTAISFRTDCGSFFQEEEEEEEEEVVAVRCVTDVHNVSEVLWM